MTRKGVWMFVACSLLLCVCLAVGLGHLPGGAGSKSQDDAAAAPLSPRSPSLSTTTEGRTNRAAPALQPFGRLPMSFEANMGQWDSRARFRARQRGGSVFVTDGGATFTLPGERPADDPASPRRGPHGREPFGPGALHRSNVLPDTWAAQTPLRLQPSAFSMKVVGADPAAHASGAESLPGKANFFLGNDPAQWRTNVPTYSKVSVPAVYPGIDLVYYGNQGQLEYDFTVAPGADPGQVRVAFEGVDRLELSPSGDLLITVAGREVVQRRPRVYQDGPDGPRELGAAYVVLGGDLVAFHVEGRDPRRAMVIDPVLVYSTYLGGSSDDCGRAIAVDSSGNVYVTGETLSSNFPITLGARQTTIASAGYYDAFVAKLNPSGSALVYSTYLGGSSNDSGYGIAVDSSGNVYVTGDTSSTNFPTTAGALQTVFGGGSYDAFVAKLNPSGSVLSYSTFLGSSQNDYSQGIAVNGSGNAFVTGSTSSTNFPITAGALQTVLGGLYDAFVAKLNPSGSALSYSTFLGGSNDDSGEAVAIDGSGNAYVTGFTYSPTFPTTAGAPQTVFGGLSDAFVAKLSPSGSVLSYSTFLGGSSYDFSLGIAVDGSGNAFVTGTTSSTNFPTTAGALQTVFGGASRDAFVTKLNFSGSAFSYSVFLGGSSDDYGLGIAADNSGNAFVTGYTYSSNFPTTAGALQPAIRSNGYSDAFVAKLNPSGSALSYSTFLGGSSYEYGFGIFTDSSGNAFVTGQTWSSNFPTNTGVPQTVFGGSGDSFIAKISALTLTSLTPSSGPTSGGTQVTLTGDGFASGTTVSFGGLSALGVTLVNGTTLIATAPAHASGTVNVVVTNPGGGSFTLAASYTYVPPPTVTAVSPASGPAAGGTSVTITGTGFQSGAYVSFGDIQAASVTVDSSTSITAVSPTHAAGTVSVTVTDTYNQSATRLAAFTFVAPPTVAAVAPAYGPVTGGTNVTISGTGFQSGATVTFGGAIATDVALVTATTITATAPAHAAGQVNVVVKNPSPDNQTGTFANGFLYVPPPAVTGVTPSSGPTAGGTAVTIAGSGFQTGATVTFGGTAAANVNVVSATTITATTPAHAAATVDIVVKNPDNQTGTKTAAFIFVAPPTITSINIPSPIPCGSGATVTITGTAFQSGATVTFGGTAATNVVVVSSTTITATRPALAAGTFDVTVTNPDGQSATKTAGFTCVPQPTINSVTPTSGPTAGGTVVTITGTGFQAGATVTFGGTAASGVAVNSSTSITATTPGHSAGTVAVIVTNPDSQSSNSGSFTFVPPPDISSVSPTSGLSAGGTTVTIAGSGFQPGATVTFGGTAATNVNVVSATTITATTPAHAAGAVDVVVRNTDNQTGTKTAVFTFVAPPAVTTVNPTSGPTAGGTGVTITGSGFQTGATVTFGGTAATGVTVVDSSTITATTPAHSAGLTDVVVTNPDGQSVRLDLAFTFVPPPSITGISPTQGDVSGGTTASIYGSGFQPGASVTFGGVAASDVVVSSSSLITATTPAHAEALVDVAVTNPDLQSSTLNAAFSYVASPVVTAVAPSSGRTAGGTAVTISGSTFRAGATVTFGGTAATDVTIVDSSTITATTPAHSAGPVDVTVTNLDGRLGTLSAGFTYLAPPTLAELRPSAGTVDGEFAFEAVGTGFQPGAKLRVDGTEASSVTVVNATSITAVAPPHAEGAADVQIVNPDGQSITLHGSLTYLRKAEHHGGGCSSTGASGGALLGMALLLLASRRRRR